MIFEVDFTGKNVEMISAKILTALYINNTWSCFTINLMEGKPSRKRAFRSRCAEGEKGKSCGESYPVLRIQVLCHAGGCHLRKL